MLFGTSNGTSNGTSKPTIANGSHGRPLTATKSPKGGRRTHRRKKSLRRTKHSRRK